MVPVTAGELISKLLEFPADLPVMLDMDDAGYAVEGVELDVDTGEWIWIFP